MPQKLVKTHLNGKGLVFTEEERLILVRNEPRLFRARLLRVDDVSQRHVLETNLLPNTVVVGNVDSGGNSGTKVANDIDAREIGLQENRLRHKNRRRHTFSKARSQGRRVRRVGAWFTKSVRIFVKCLFMMATKPSHSPLTP